LRSKVVVRPEAREELSEAARWYRGKSALVAVAFREAVRDTVARIAEHPEAFSEVALNVRRALTPRFPYAIFYSIENSSIVILAAKHQAQNPAGWPRGG
jgi:plasmid stabilization system protein ParE